MKFTSNTVIPSLKPTQWKVKVEILIDIEMMGKISPTENIGPLHSFGAHGTRVPSRLNTVLANIFQIINTIRLCSIMNAKIHDHWLG